MKSKKILVLAAAIPLMLFTLSACSLEVIKGGDSTLTGTIGVNDEVIAAETEIKSITTKHLLNYNGSDFIINSVYSLDKTVADNWLFTIPSTVNLALHTENVPDNIELLVSQVYSDISTSSKYVKYNGLRQDSVNIEYKELPNGGINVDDTHYYEMPFRIEAVDKNETFFYMYNGYGRSSSYRITETTLGEEMNGAILNTVWTVLIKDKDSNKIYMKSITDSIKIPYNRNNKMSSSSSNK